MSWKLKVWNSSKKAKYLEKRCTSLISRCLKILRSHTYHCNFITRKFSLKSKFSTKNIRHCAQENLQKNNQETRQVLFGWKSAFRKQEDTPRANLQRFLPNYPLDVLKLEINTWVPLAFCKLFSQMINRSLLSILITKIPARCPQVVEKIPSFTYFAPLNLQTWGEEEQMKNN